MDIAELGFRVDSSGLVESTKALDQNAAAADKASGSADRLERYFQSMSRSIDRSAVVLGDRLGGALDRIGAGTGTVIAELQGMNRVQAEIVSALVAMESRLTGTAAGLQAYSGAGKDAAAGASATASASEKLERQLEQQEARYRSVAQQAMAYAEAQRTANVSDRALAEAARDSAAGIDHHASALSRAGTEQERTVARARALQEAEARTANQVREAARAAEVQELNLKRLLSQIDPTVAGLNRLADMEERLERAGDLGLIKPQVMQQYQAQIEVSRQALLKSKNTNEQYAMSARQTAAAMRMIPAQMTDIVTSIVSGQPIWMVAIQQGGQLKDQLGGIGPAAKAVTSYVMGMVNPLTVSAAAALALAVALKQGQDELFDFQKNLILTGRNADISGSQFRGLVSDLDKLTGVTRGGAVDALTAVAASGQFAGKQFTMVAEAAARMEASTGQATSKTVEAFQRIARDPVDALVELNKQEGFLNTAQLQRIITLQEEGRQQEAVAEALQLYYERSINVANQTEAVMPGMAQGWRTIKDEISGAWGALVNFGGALTDVGRNSGLQDSWIAKLASAGPRTGFAFLHGLNEEMSRLSAQARNPYGLPAPISEETPDNRKAVEDYSKALQESQTAEKAASEALNARMAGLDRAASKQQALNKIIEIYNKLPENDSRHFDGSMQRLIARSNAQVDKQFNQREGIGRANTDDNAAQSLVASIRRQITANQQLAESGDKVTTSDRLVIQAQQLLADKTDTMTAAQREALKAAIPLLQASDAQAEKAKQTQRDLVAQAALTERLTQLEKQRQEQSDVDLMGIGRGADATQVLQRQLDIQREYLREREKLEKEQRGQNPLSQGEYQNEVALLEASRERSLEIERSYQQQRMQLLGDWRTGFRRVWEDYEFSAGNASEAAATTLVNGLSAAEDAFVRFVQTGKLSFSDLAKSILADLARIAARQAIVGAVGSIVGSLAGGSSGTWTGTSAGAGSNLNFGNNVDSFTGSSWASFGGGRAGGGDVSNSSMYEVGEFDRPEIFNDRRGRSYLIPGNDGTVVPMHQLASGNGGGSATPTVNVSINTVVQSDGNSSTSATAGDDNAMGRSLAKLIEPEVKRVLAQQMRPGGLLTGVR
ncbi:phage tail tape measure protein [Xanthomonas phaseoli]|uniref:phage tail tape measure protein n=2 Tax=Xanthomonas TaxID=338 RepID=UPI001ADA21F7|nr:phage tail tape measure protein [Xanthomonas phaseoli]MBO9766521.1 phage tail tape measure protein [Xanthomonas phaseoli pv. dieffenbachiae]MBO9776134.1 phage tail tape measure protein [Xanthomonas phaseoli pv. dieffenbachiae]MBO9778268.1 phage tail tape measure protein [Xanthomonas phaseoli pv. dieffenbachiae]MBO9795344.1 phage tail tape measure protein [Xanthomonas phaseoli pv. dieffenbachiae]MBO9801461.1 phage tail tape measure protein [Xanthomonas phaseoli pv. dieffenbachiae]